MEATPLVTVHCKLCVLEESHWYCCGCVVSSDRLDLLTSLQDVRLDNRRLAERERQLQASLDVSEEQLRGLQTENTSLQQQLHRFASPPPRSNYL